MRTEKLRPGTRPEAEQKERDGRVRKEREIKAHGRYAIFYAFELDEGAEN